MKNNNNNINIAEIESNHIDNLIKKPTIQGFPTIKMYNNGKEVANFEDERVADKMETFALHNSKKIKSKKYKTLNKLNNKVNTTNTNNNSDLFPKKHITNNNTNTNKNTNKNKNTNTNKNKNMNTNTNKHKNMNNDRNTITNIETKECKKYVIPKQCKSIPYCTFDYKIKKCIVKKPKSIKKMINEQPVMEQPMMEQPVMEQPMMEQPVMEQPVMEQPVMEQPMMEQPMMLTAKTTKPKTLRCKTPTPRTTKPKTLRRKTPTPRTKKNKNNYDLKKSTKSVFSKLINSFDRIGDEARKDAELLTEARHLL